MSMKRKPQHDRVLAIRRYLKGENPSTIARSMGYSRQWVYKWVERYEVGDEAVDWSQSRPPAPHSNPRRLSDSIVEAVKLVRLNLYNQGLFCGAQAIEWELRDLGVEPL